MQSSLVGIRDKLSQLERGKGKGELTLENDLMDDTGARSPELDTILLCCTLQEIENFLVGNDRPLQAISQDRLDFLPILNSSCDGMGTCLEIRFSSLVSADQVITVNRGRDCCSFPSTS